MWDDFDKNIKEGKWRNALLALLDIVKNNPAGWQKRWIHKIYLAKRVGAKKGEKYKAIDLCEKAMSYIRKLIIEVRLHDEARALYIHQMKFRKWVKLNQKKDYVGWLFNVTLWLFLGYRKSYGGLVRLFLTTIIIILLFAIIYSWPHPRIEYVPGEYRPPNFKLCWLHYIYFSGMAITTVGYGDIHPIPTDKLALVLSVTEAIIGYILLGVFVAVLVGIDEPVETPYWPDKKVEEFFSELRI